MTKVKEPETIAATIADKLVSNWDNIPVENIGEGVERQMFVGQNMMICRLRFAPFSIAAAHEHPHEQMTFIEKGRAKFTIGDAERIVKAGDVLSFPPNIRHGAAILDEEVVLIDIFTPLREDFLKRA